MLRREIVTPLHSYTFRLVATSMACGVIGAAFALSAQPALHVPPAPAPATHEVVSTKTVLASSSEVHLVFRAAGTTYIKLGDALPAHGTPTLYDRGEVDGWQTVAIARVDEVPGWRGKTVMVDETCEAKVTGFAVVARLTGSPDYAPLDAQKWTAENVLEAGAPVLAASLDGCVDGVIARDAARAAIVPMPPRDDAALEHGARAKLLASPVGVAAQREWRANDRKGAWQRAETAAFHTLVTRHPITGVTWVSVHGRIDEGCGGPEINIWGLYRGDALVPVQERPLGELHAIAKLVDVDGDGEPELLGAPWNSNETLVTRARGDELARLALPFYGCSC